MSQLTVSNQLDNSAINDSLDMNVNDLTQPNQYQPSVAPNEISNSNDSIFSQLIDNTQNCDKHSVNNYNDNIEDNNDDIDNNNNNNNNTNNSNNNNNNNNNNSNNFPLDISNCKLNIENNMISDATLTNISSIPCPVDLSFNPSDTEYANKMIPTGTYVTSNEDSNSMAKMRMSPEDASEYLCEISNEHTQNKLNIDYANYPSANWLRLVNSNDSEQNFVVYQCQELMSYEAGIYPEPQIYTYRGDDLMKNQKKKSNSKRSNLTQIRKSPRIANYLLVKQEAHAETNLVTNSSQNVLKKEMPYSCNICSKKFSKLSNYTTHSKVHAGDKPCICNLCHKSFLNKSSLQVHMRTHTGEKPFSCEHCEKTFSALTNKNAHLRTHTGEKPFSCDICSKTFANNSSLNSHLRTHTREKPFPCNFCDKAFSFKANLMDHIRTHTGERPHSCNLCGRGFLVKANLNTHMRTHTGEKPFNCNVCDRTFSLRANLKIHMRKHTGEKPYTCMVCEKSFSVFSNWKTHLKSHSFSEQ